jgi:uncharacterized membrane protein YhdT
MSGYGMRYRRPLGVDGMELHIVGREGEKPTHINVSNMTMLYLFMFLVELQLITVALQPVTYFPKWFNLKSMRYLVPVVLVKLISTKERKLLKRLPTAEVVIEERIYLRSIDA